MRWALGDRRSGLAISGRSSALPHFAAARLVWRASSILPFRRLSTAWLLISACILEMNHGATISKRPRRIAADADFDCRRIFRCRRRHFASSISPPFHFAIFGRAMPADFALAAARPMRRRRPHSLAPPPVTRPPLAALRHLLLCRRAAALFGMPDCSHSYARDYEEAGDFRYFINGACH